MKFSYTPVSSTPQCRRQGNGNFEGFMLLTYNDGSTSEAQFIMNAKTTDQVVATYERLKEENKL